MPPNHRRCGCIVLPVTEEGNLPLPDPVTDSQFDEAAFERANRAFNKDRGLMGKLSDRFFDFLRRNAD